MDWASRKVLSWRLSNTLDTSFCLEALEEAIEQYGCPEIFNSDQGSQVYLGSFYRQTQSPWYPNQHGWPGPLEGYIFIERLWKNVKYEEVYLKAYDSIAIARRELRAYFDFYNKRRWHQGLKGKLPNEIYWSTLPQEIAA